MKNGVLRVCLWALLLSTVACSVPLQIKDHARRTNQIVWQVHSEMILKNILRAPCHGIPVCLLCVLINSDTGTRTFTCGRRHDQ